MEMASFSLTEDWNLSNLQDLLKKNQRAFIRYVNKITRLQGVIQAEERKVAACLAEEKRLIELMNQF
jgi:hypothetical protein